MSELDRLVLKCPEHGRRHEYDRPFPDRFPVACDDRTTGVYCRNPLQRWIETRDHRDAADEIDPKASGHDDGITALTELWRFADDLMKNFPNRITNNPHLASNVTVEGFMRLEREGDAMRDQMEAEKAKWRNWLYRMAGARPVEGDEEEDVEYLDEEAEYPSRAEQRAMEIDFERSDRE